MAINIDENFVDYLKFSPKIDGIDTPIYFENSIIQDYILWTVTHRSNNPMNTQTEKFTKEPETAIKQRALQLTSRIKNSIEQFRFLKSTETYFTINFHANGLNGRTAVNLTCQIVNLSGTGSVLIVARKLITEF